MGALSFGTHTPHRTVRESPRPHPCLSRSPLQNLPHTCARPSSWCMPLPYVHHLSIRDVCREVGFGGGSRDGRDVGGRARGVARDGGGGRHGRCPALLASVPGAPITAAPPKADLP